MSHYYNRHERHETGELRSPDEHLDRQIAQLYDAPEPSYSQPTNADGQPRYDARATELVQLEIDNTEELYHLVQEIITRAYEDAALAELADPHAITAPRADAGDALREYFDEYNPLSEEPSIYHSLIDFALDRCDWYAIVDDMRRRMSENHAAMSL